MCVGGRPGVGPGDYNPGGATPFTKPKVPSATFGNSRVQRMSQRMRERAPTASRGRGRAGGPQRPRRPVPLQSTAGCQYSACSVVRTLEGARAYSIGRGIGAWGNAQHAEHTTHKHNIHTHAHGHICRIIWHGMV